MDDYKENSIPNEEEINQQTKVDVSDKEIKQKNLSDNSEEFQILFSSYIQSIESFSKNYENSYFEASLMDLSQLISLIQEYQLDLINNHISSQSFLEVLDENDFLNISISIFETSITKLYLQLCSFINIMQKTFPELIDYFSQIDLFGALCAGIVNFNEEDDDNFDFSPIFALMNDFVSICAKKYNPILDCLFSNTCDIIAFLTSEFPVADVLEFLIKVVNIETLQPRDLSLIPFALVDEFCEEVRDVQTKEEIDPNIIINFSILFSIILDKNPYTAVIFQNETFGVYNNLMNKFQYFEEDKEVVLELIRFFSSYTRSISIIDESIRNPLITKIEENVEDSTSEQYQHAMNYFNKNYPKDFLRTHINPKITSYLSGEDKEEIIVALRYLQSLAMINPNLLYNGFLPKTLYDFCIDLIQNQTNNIKLECFKFADILINQNDTFFITSAIGTSEFLETCTDAAESMDSSLFELYINILNGLYNASNRMDVKAQEIFRSYIYDLEILDLVDNIYKTLEEGELQDKTYQLLVHLNSV